MKYERTNFPQPICNWFGVQVGFLEAGLLGLRLLYTLRHLPQIFFPHLDYPGDPEGHGQAQPEPGLLAYPFHLNHEWHRLHRDSHQTPQNRNRF